MILNMPIRFCNKWLTFKSNIFCLKDLALSLDDILIDAGKVPIFFTPKIISMPEPGYYHLGGNPSYKRTIKSYVALLKKITTKRRNVTNKDRGRFLCLAFLRVEVPKHELATKNATGKSRDKDMKVITIPRLDQEILAAIFTQAQHQFPEFTDAYTDSSCDTIQAINDVCKRERGRSHTSDGQVQKIVVQLINRR